RAWRGTGHGSFGGLQARSQRTPALTAVPDVHVVDILSHQETARGCGVAPAQEARKIPAPRTPCMSIRREGPVTERLLKLLREHPGPDPAPTGPLDEPIAAHSSLTRRPGGG